MLTGNIRAVLFDAVGTLIYPDPPVAEVYHCAGRKLGSKYSREEIAQRFPLAIKKHHQGDTTSEEQERQRWERIVYDVMDDFDDPDRRLLNELWRHFGSATSWQLYDDVAPVWWELARQGYLLGIASNFDGRLRAICRGLPPLDGCERIFVSSEVGFSKPVPRYYRAVEHQLGLKAEQILLVGDDYEADVSGPQAAGWKTMWLRRREAKRSDKGRGQGVDSSLCTQHSPLCTLHELLPWH
jgi:putative hydrolase of the HAD superfamily